MSKSPNVSVNLGGIRAKTAGWIGVVCTVIGLALGVWGTMTFLRFEPSAAYVAQIDELNITISATADSLDTVRDSITAADEAVEDLLEQGSRVAEDLEDARTDADAHRARADSLHAANEAAGDVVRLRAETDALRAALTAREMECGLCRAALAQRDLTIGALQVAVSRRDTEIRLLTTENASLLDAIDRANEELRRASGRFNSWKFRIGAGTVVLAGVAVLVFH